MPSTNPTLAESYDDISRTALLAWLTRLDQIDNPRPIMTEAQYRIVAKVKRMLAALYCLTFNEKHEAFDRVADIEGKYGEVMFQFNKGLLIKDPTVKLVARYMLWSYRLKNVDSKVPFLVARAYGVLRKVTRGEGRDAAIVVVGLQRKVGDNVFTRGTNGRFYRNFVHSYGRQAFELPRSPPFNAAEHASFLDSLPELDPTYHVVPVADGKFCARSSAFSRKAMLDATRLFSNDWATSLAIQQPARPSSGDVVIDEQDLFDMPAMPLEEGPAMEERILQPA